MFKLASRQHQGLVEILNILETFHSHGAKDFNVDKNEADMLLKKNATTTAVAGRPLKFFAKKIAARLLFVSVKEIIKKDTAMVWADRLATLKRN